MSRGLLVQRIETDQMVSLYQDGLSFRDIEQKLGRDFLRKGGQALWH